MSNSDDSKISAWLSGRLPEPWTLAGAPRTTIDRDEITVILALASPETDADASDADKAEALAGRVAGFREETRDQRVGIAREAEHRFDRKFSWGVTIADQTAVFTHLASPVMTRLRQSERQVLDTLVAANVARSRSDALAWCVRLVGRNTDEWLANLRTAMEEVDKLRDEGPDAN
jgi:hypothetical protein